MDREWLRERLERGDTIAAIAREAGRHPSTVHYWLDQHGLERPRSIHVSRGAIARDQLTELVAADLTVREIAERVNRSFSTVRYWLAEYGLETTRRARTKRLGGPPREVLRCDLHGEVEHIAHRDGGRTCVRCRADSVTSWRRHAKTILVEEAGGACVLCGYDRCVVALHFHHVDPARKRFGLGGRGLARSIDVLREEAAKCVLLCSNCHAEVEAGMADLRLRCARRAAPTVAHDPG